jgi:hypothetical protein
MNKGPPNKFGKTKQLKKKSAQPELKKRTRKTRPVPWPLAATR